MNPENLNVIQMVLHAGAMVQFVILILFLFSVATWAIIFVKFFQIQKAYSESAFFIEYFWKTRDFAGSFSKAKALKYSPVARVFRVAFMELRKLNRSGRANSRTESGGIAADDRFAGMANLKRALSRASTMESVRMIQLVPFLATTGNIAPFIGLFGTVWGIMHSFHGIAYKRGVTSLAAVAPGISEALVATAAGLAVAIPAVIAFNYFSQKIRVIESEMESFSSDFLNIIQSDSLAGKEA
ncbi:MAG: Tol-Pal system subunit TolQ [Deltaproteobacteria bacterium]|nr:Tol-Pal system subunit TolQ [Deltaproteobacteria bacterium]